jgi:4-carboxymuconolactone decarboxylase
VSLAAIVAAGMVGPPLSVHVRTGLASGLAPAELAEVVVQAAAFAGFPRAVSAAERLNALFAEAGVPSPPPRAPREAALAFCADESHGLATPAVRALLADAERLTVQALGPDTVVVDCPPAGLLRLRVEGGEVVEAAVHQRAG